MPGAFWLALPKRRCQTAWCEQRTASGHLAGNPGSSSPRCGRRGRGSKAARRKRAAIPSIWISSRGHRAAGIPRRSGRLPAVCLQGALRGASFVRTFSVINIRPDLSQLQHRMQRSASESRSCKRKQQRQRPKKLRMAPAQPDRHGRQLSGRPVEEESCEGPRQFAPEGACCVPAAGLRSGEEHGYNEVGFLDDVIGAEYPYLC